MKTKVLLSLSAAALVNAAQLSAAPQISSGAYAGVAAGVSVLGGKNELTLLHDAAGLAPQAVQNQASFSLSRASTAAMIFGGYGAKVSGFWLAGELFYQFDSLKNKQSPTFGAESGSILKSSSAGAYGASAHLGFFPADNCVVYAILGIETRGFKMQFSGPAALTSASINKRYTSVAFVPGVGTRFALTNNISIRAEYKYAMHRSKTVSSSTSSANTPGQTDVAKIKYQPRIQSFNVGLVYNF